MLRRAQLVYGLLFVISYVTSVLYLKPPAAHSTVANIRQSLAQAGPMIQGLVRSAALSASQAGTSNAAPTRASVAQVVLPSTHTNSEAQELPPLPPVSLSVDYSSPKNAFMELDVVAQSDERAEYRLAAVGALHAVATTSGDANGRIRETLRMATADGDPRVAAAAESAYREVSAWSPARE